MSVHHEHLEWTVAAPQNFIDVILLLLFFISMYYLLLCFLPLVGIILLIGLSSCLGDGSTAGLRLIRTAKSSRHLYTLLDGSLNHVTSVEIDLLLWGVIIDIPNFLLIGHIFVAVYRLYLPRAVAILSELPVISCLALQKEHIGGLWRWLRDRYRCLVALSLVPGVIGIDFFLAVELFPRAYIVDLVDVLLILLFDELKLCLWE